MPRLLGSSSSMISMARTLGAPVTEPLRSYPVKIEGGRVWLALD